MCGSDDAERIAWLGTCGEKEEFPPISGSLARSCLEIGLLEQRRSLEASCCAWRGGQQLQDGRASPCLQLSRS